MKLVDFMLHQKIVQKQTLKFKYYQLKQFSTFELDRIKENPIFDILILTKRTVFNLIGNNF